MTAQFLYGQPVADAVIDDLRPRVKALTEAGHQPGLATLLVGERPDSAAYIRGKIALCEELGMRSEHVQLTADATQPDVDAVIDRVNADAATDGFLFQYPPPDHIDHTAAIMRLDADKDVDGMHPLNLGRLAAGLPGPIPCTPAGVEAMLAHYEIPVSGRHVVVLGRGVNLGRPLSLLLSLKRPTANAAVTVVHTGVPNWPDYTREAEIVVAGVGVPGIVQPEHIRPGAVVLSPGATYKGRNTVVPDVDESCAEVASWITPRLGGVGKTTIAMLMRNTVEAAERRWGKP